MIRNKCPSQTNVLFYSLPIVMVVKEQVQQQEQNGAYAASECFIARTPFVCMYVCVYLYSALSMLGMLQMTLMRTGHG